MLLFTKYRWTWLTAISMSLCRCIACQDVFVQQSLMPQKACYHNIKLTYIQICCHVIVTQWRPTVEQSARDFRNPPLQKKKRTWVNCKLITVTAWHYNCESDSSAVCVSYRQKMSFQESNQLIGMKMPMLQASCLQQLYYCTENKLVEKSPIILKQPGHIPQALQPVKTHY